MFATKFFIRSASAGTATVRAVKRRSLIPTRAALTLVSLSILSAIQHEFSFKIRIFRRQRL